MNIAEMRDALFSFDGSGMASLLEELEKKRKSAFNVFLLGIFVSATIVFYLMLISGLSDVTKVAGMSAAIAGLLLYHRVVMVRRAAKLKLMPALCAEIGLDYAPTAPGIIVTPFKQLTIVPSYDEKELEDHISGQVDGIDFELCEAKLVQVTRDSKGRKSRSTVFRGFLVEFDFHKNFSGETIITKDHTFIGNFFTGFGRKGERVKLESSDFEDEFEVYSTDQVEARYLLTPSFMERALNFSRTSGVDQLQFAFKAGSIYMAIKRSENAFEGGSFDLNDPKLIEHNIKDIAMIFDMVTELKLDQDSKI